MEEANLNEWFQALLAASAERSDAIQAAYQQARDGGFLSKLTLHRYQCKRGCQLAVVFRAGQSTLCAVRDYKYSPGLNEASSVASARVSKTLDGDRHWPSHVYDVDELTDWGERTGMSVTCRHFRGVISGAQVLQDIGSARPGHPWKPTRLSHM